MDIFHLLRSKHDGQYLVAHARNASGEAKDIGYLLLFKEHADALSYLNTHGSGVADRFGVESISKSQLTGLLNRWGFTGIGVVEDPLLPRVDFLERSRGF
jgi:hypothetical protein